MDGWMDGWMDRQIDKQTNKQTNRPIDLCVYTLTYIYIYMCVWDSMVPPHPNGHAPNHSAMKIKKYINTNIHVMYASLLICGMCDLIASATSFH